MKIIHLILFNLSLQVFCGGHSLHYYQTAVSAPGFGSPLSSEVGIVNDRVIEKYNSDTRLYVPKVDWMKKMDSEYWARELQRSVESEPVFQHRLHTLMRRFNHTGGFHIVQRMYGCELRNDGSTMGFNRHRYDDKDFIYLDTQRWIWIPVSHAAELTAQRWNSPEEKVGEQWKNYLQNQCIEDLKKLIEYGREDLEKKVRPEVKLWGHRQSDGVTRLQCLVHGFYPRDIDVRWMKNEEDYVPTYEMTPILPHPDGTYQVKVSVEVTTNEGFVYSCYVEHSSLGNETLSVLWAPSSNTSSVITVVVSVVLLIIICVIMVKKICSRDNNTDNNSSPEENNEDKNLISEENNEDKNLISEDNNTDNSSYKENNEDKNSQL